MCTCTSTCACSKILCGCSTVSVQAHVSYLAGYILPCTNNKEHRRRHCLVGCTLLLICAGIWLLKLCAHVHPQVHIWEESYGLSTVSMHVHVSFLACMTLSKPVFSLERGKDRRKSQFRRLTSIEICGLTKSFSSGV